MHEPVLLRESIELLGVSPGGVYMDCTFGGGGHAAEILKRLEGTGRLVALDQDPDAVDRGGTLAALFPNLDIYRENFAGIASLAERLGLTGRVNGILADLGTSMFQLKDAARGFSFSEDGPLDMRMDPDSSLTAARVLNSYPESELVRIFQEYGEERHARRIAREVVAQRKRTPFRTTRQFAVMIEQLAGNRPSRIHPATRCFQALRIEVNQEMTSLAQFLENAWRVLAVGGRLVVISFHSLEDRLVKQFMRRLARRCVCPETAERCTCGGDRAEGRLLTRKVVRPSEAEAAANRASRSARLRAVEKIREAV